MNASKTTLLTMGAMFAIAATSIEASARIYEGNAEARPSAADSLFWQTLPILSGERASISSPQEAAIRVAINPQPLPPRGDEE
ncbi:hypothetical protein [Methylocapsa acidiphila]|uniref:hypothetical protein n=1 Tax=Methylocapsa acidiphila TaxID=133552 RepID=UPI00040CD8EE|nr:hypothetical protein [Methylocapsa acidiphila]